MTVIQSANKAYRWRMAELTPDGKWFAVDEQRDSEKTYGAAMAAGLVQLQGMIEDLVVGPREEDPEAPPRKRKGRAVRLRVRSAASVKKPAQDSPKQSKWCE